jgi:hypothetical protein
MDEPFVNFATRLDLESAERRRRLERQTGLPTRHLLASALRALEADLNQRRAEQAS